MFNKRLLSLALFGLLFGSALAVQFPEEASIEIAPTEFRQEALPLVNNESFDVSVTVSREGMASTWALLPTTDFTITSGEVYQIPIYFTVPEGTAEGTYSGKLKYDVIVNGTPSTHYTTINFEVTKLRHDIFDKFLYVGEQLEFGEYTLKPIDVSLTGHSCWIQFEESGEVLYDGTITTEPEQVVSGVQLYITDSLVMAGGDKACRIVVTTEQEYETRVLGESEGTEPSDGEEENVIKIQGTFEQGRTIIFETSSGGSLLSGKILIVSQVNDPTYLETDGLTMWQVPHNETGAVILKFYMGSKLIDYKSILLGTEQEPNEPNGDGAGQGEQPTEPDKPKLVAISSPNLSPEDPIRVEVRNENGVKIAGVWVKITKPDGSFLSDDTMSDGVIQFTPPSDGWDEGQYRISVTKTGYDTSSQSVNSIRVTKPRDYLSVRMTDNGTIINQANVGQQITLQLINEDTGQIADVDGVYNVVVGEDTISANFVDGTATIVPRTNGTMSISIPQTNNYHSTSESFSITGSVVATSGGSKIGIGWYALFGLAIIVGIFLIVRKFKGGKKKSPYSGNIGFTPESEKPVKVVETIEEG